MAISYWPKFLTLKAIIRGPKSMKTDKRDWLSKQGTNSRGIFHLQWRCTYASMHNDHDKWRNGQAWGNTIADRKTSHKKLVPDRRKLLVGEIWKGWILLTKIRNNTTPSKIKQLISSKFQSRSSLIVTETDQNLGYKENKRIRSFNLKADKTSKIAYRYMNLWQHHIIWESNLLHACKNFLCTTRRSCWNYLQHIEPHCLW